MMAFIDIFAEEKSSPNDPRNLWLQCVKACGRLDLELNGPKYPNENCYLCHLHFEEKWYKINNIRASLHPDAIPTKFCRPSLNQNSYVKYKGKYFDCKTTIGIQKIEIIKNKAEQQKNEEIQEQEELQRIETDIQQEERNE
ncbi:hypothetical protein EAG_01286 [Camponotus floridanus]|uniref:THAP-type domain-containing protein n=1 Tax=Camponotus floridanus TaxID=104421 RepID=E2AER4_CAMFO|nr:hypothetical protein EAG_01286 [Camponotus floridanus]